MKIELPHKNPYTWSGLALLIAGLLVSPFAYFVLQLTWLTALGICMLILSFILIALGRTIPKLPPEVCSLLLETGIDNIAAIVEELGIKAKAVYLPSSITGDRPQALVPLHANPSLPLITQALPQRLIVRYGSRPDDIGLLLSTIGSITTGMLEVKPRPTSAELESALTSLFIGHLGIADRASVSCQENIIRVEIHQPHIEDGVNWSHHCLGGPLASIVASVSAEAWNKPVTIKQERIQNGKHYVEVEVMA